MTSDPGYRFRVTPPRCERCAAPPAHRVQEPRQGWVVLLCEEHLEPWLEERRWAVVRMGAPLGWDASKEEWSAYYAEAYAEAIEVTYEEN